MRSSTDVRVSHNVSMSRQLYNSKERERHLKTCELFGKAVEILSRLLDVPQDMQVRLCCFKTDRRNGDYIHSLKTARIAPKLTLNMIRTLAHEMVHAEQFHQKRLEWTGNAFSWNGARNGNKGSTYARYRAQPWEVEAFDRQNELAEIVFEELGM